MSDTKIYAVAREWVPGSENEYILSVEETTVQRKGKTYVSDRMTPISFGCCRRFLLDQVHLTPARAVVAYIAEQAFRAGGIRKDLASAEARLKEGLRLLASLPHKEKP